MKIDIQSLGTFQGKESDQPGKGDQQLPSLRRRRQWPRGHIRNVLILNIKKTTKNIYIHLINRIKIKTI